MERRRDEAHAVKPPHFQTLPSLGEVQLLIDLTFNEDVDFEVLAAEVAARASIKALVFRAANGIGIGAVREIRSLRHALAILGLARVRELLYALRSDVSQSQGPVSGRIPAGN